jgi:hypothetical protein
MGPESQAALSKADVSAPAARSRVRAERWPLYWSVFGAVAASLVLWAGIFFAIDVAADVLASFGAGD